MTRPNCSVGDLAITVNCQNPENRGNIVLILSAYGEQSWGNCEPEFTWNCEIVSSGWLVYDVDGYITTAKVGLVPDSCLKPITPPPGYLMEEVADSELISLDFYDADSI